MARALLRLALALRCNCHVLLWRCSNNALGHHAHPAASVRSKDRLPRAREAADPGRITAGTETPMSSSSTAARPASAAAGNPTIGMTDHTSPAITAPSDKSNATRIGQRWKAVAIKHIQKNKTANKNTKTIPSVGSSNVCWARVLDKALQTLT